MSYEFNVSLWVVADVSASDAKRIKSRLESLIHEASLKAMGRRGIDRIEEYDLIVETPKKV